MMRIPEDGWLLSGSWPLGGQQQGKTHQPGSKKSQNLWSSQKPASDSHKPKQKMIVSMKKSFCHCQQIFMAPCLAWGATCELLGCCAFDTVLSVCKHLLSSNSGREFQLPHKHFSIKKLEKRLVMVTPTLSGPGPGPALLVASFVTSALHSCWELCFCTSAGHCCWWWWFAKRILLTLSIHFRLMRMTCYHVQGFHSHAQKWGHQVSHLTRDFSHLPSISQPKKRWAVVQDEHHADALCFNISSW